MKKIIYSIILILLVSIGYSQCPTGSISLSGSGNINIGSTQKYCIPQGTTFTGSISVNNGGTLTINGTFKPSSLNFNGGSIINKGKSVLPSFNINSSCVFINTDTIVVNGSMTINSNGTFTNSGKITISSSSTNNGKLTNSGTIIYNSTFTNNSNSQIINSGNVTFGGNVTNNSSITNSGTISIIGTILNNGGSTITNQNNIFVTSTFTNNGTLKNTGLFAASNFLENKKPIVYSECPSGSIPIYGSGTVTMVAGKSYCIPKDESFTGILTNNGGTLTSSGKLNPKTLIFNSGTIVNNGTCEIPSSLTLKTGAVFTNAGTTQINGSLNSDANAIINNTGTLTVTASSTNKGKITNSGAITYTGKFTNATNAQITNTGNLLINGDCYNNATLTSSGTLNIVGQLINNVGGKITNESDFQVAGNLTNNSNFNNNGSIFVKNIFTNNTGATFTNNKFTLIENLFNNTGTFVNNGTCSAKNYNEKKSVQPSIVSIDDFETILLEGGYYDSLGRIPMIVKFKELSILEKQFNNIPNNYDYESQFNLFANQLSTYLIQAGYDSNLLEIGIKLSLVTNIVSIKAPRELFDIIKKFPNVSDVTLDIKYGFTVNESLSLINAVETHNSQNTGQGVRIGVIDSGIDFYHPAFAAINGVSPFDAIHNKIIYDQPGCKVCGGYDFGDYDYNPLDKLSHGTHVSGIIAGNGGGIIGVAPNAQLYVLKVSPDVGPNGLPARGGSESSILAALDWSVDPSKDGITSGHNDDRLDIINISMSDESQNQISFNYEMGLRNVVKFGITICAAVGNSGRYQNIGSPAVVDDVIAVGATDKIGGMYSGSNKGPAIMNLSSGKTYIMKPDVVAPGEAITSSVLYDPLHPETMNASQTGTSMASPMVAGACALLLKAHPEWSSVDLKSILMSTADIIPNLDIMVQGSGEINVGNAISASTMVYRIDEFNNKMGIGPVLNFGNIFTLSTPIWTSVRLKILIKNTSQISKNYSIPKLNLPSGIQILIGTTNLSQSNYSISNVLPNGEIILEFHVNVDANNLTLDVNKFFGGHIFIQNNADLQDISHISWNVNLNDLQSAFTINFIDQISEVVIKKPQFLLLNNTSRPSIQKQVIWNSDLYANVVVDEGTYDLVVMYQDLDNTVIYVQDDVIFNRTNPNITINLTANKFLIDLKKQNGEPFADPRLVFFMSRYAGGFTPTILCTTSDAAISLPAKKLFLNKHESLKYNYVISYFDKIVDEVDNSVYMINLPEFRTYDPLTTDLTVEYKMQELNISCLKPHNYLNTRTEISLFKQWASDSYYSLPPYPESLVVNGNPSIIKVYYTGRPLVGSSNSITHNLLLRYNLVSAPYIKVLSSAYFIPTPDKFGFSEEPFGGKVFFEDAGSTSFLGSFFGYPVTSIKSNRLDLSFNGQYFEKRFYDNNFVSYTIKNSVTNEILKTESSIINSIDLSPFAGKNITIEAINENFMKDNLSVKGTLEIKLDLINNNDNYPPQFNEFKIVNDNQISHTITTCNSYVYFSTFDKDNRAYKNIQEAKMYIKMHNETIWNECVISQEENALRDRFIFKFSNIPNPGIYDIKIILTDDSENSTTWTLENIFDVPNAGIQTFTAKNQNTNAMFCTIQAAIDNALNGETILINNGTYSENLIINKAIVLKAINLNQVTIQSLFAQNIFVTCANALGGNIIFNGINFSGTTTNNRYFDILNPQSILFEDCKFQQDFRTSHLLNTDIENFNFSLKDCEFSSIITNGNLISIKGEGSSLNLENVLFKNSTVPSFILSNGIENINFKNITVEECNFNSFLEYVNDNLSTQSLNIEGISLINNHITFVYSGSFLNIANINNVSINNVIFSNNINNHIGDNSRIINAAFCENIRFNNIEINSNNQFQQIEVSNCENVEVIASKFISVNKPILFSNNIDIQIDRCFFELNTESININQSSNSNSYIINSIIANDKSNPIWIRNGNFFLYHSTIVSCFNRLKLSATNNLIKNSIIWSPDAPIFTYYSPSVIIENSICRNIKLNGIALPSLDPLFVSENDYHLQPTSPAIGIGDIAIVNVDFENNQRPLPLGTMPDIGAYENINYPIINPLNWDEIVANGGEGINPQGKEWWVIGIGNSNTQLIITESLKPEYSSLPNEQERTIAAAKTLFGDGCDAMIAAQDAWFGLGLYNNYEYDYNYTLISPDDNISNNLYTMVHAVNEIQASNKISSGTNVEYKAGEYIDFLNDFEAQEGSNLYAFIIQCNLISVQENNQLKSMVLEEDYIPSQLANDTIINNPSNKIINKEPDVILDPTCSIMPNPTTGNLRIVTEGQTIEKVSLLSLTGSKITEQNISSKDYSFDISNNPDETYLLKVVTDLKEYTYRIVLQR